MRRKEKGMSIKKKLLVAVPIVLMFASIFAVMLYNPVGDGNSGTGADDQPGAFTIGNYTFYPVSQDGVYETRIPYDGKLYAFRVATDPRNATLMHMDEEIPTKILNSTKIYITFNPNQEDLGFFGKAAYEISAITQNNGIYTKGAYTEDANPIDPNVPLKTCLDATDEATVIHMQVSEGAKDGAFIVENCIVVLASTHENLPLIADKIRLNLVGINL